MPPLNTPLSTSNHTKQRRTPVFGYACNHTRSGWTTTTSGLADHSGELALCFPVGRAVTRSPLEREVWGFNLGPVKWNPVLPTARHRCDISSKKLCCPGSMTQDGPRKLVIRFSVIQRVYWKVWFDNDALPVLESNRESTTFWSLPRRSSNWAISSELSGCFIISYSNKPIAQHSKDKACWRPSLG